MLNLFSDIKERLKQSGLVKRERTPVELVLYGIYCYILGLSLRKTAIILQPLEAIVSHVAVWKWNHKLGSKLKSSLFKKQQLPEIIIVDETEIKIGDRFGYLWIAINPYDMSVLYMKLSFSRSGLVALLFFKEMRRIYGRAPRIVITDGGLWYPYALQNMGIQHEVFSGGIRSRVESVIGRLKRKLKTFYNYFPCECRTAQHVNDILNLVVSEYNLACFVRKRSVGGDMFRLFIDEVILC